MITLIATLALTIAPDTSLYAPTPLDVVAEMLKLASIQEDDIVYDLGCGNGVIVVAASKIYKCRSVGIDISEDCVQDAQDNVNLNGVEDLVRIYQGDILETDFRSASVVTLYLMPNLLNQLKDTLFSLKPGTRIIAHDKPIPDVKPEKVTKIDSVETGREHSIYLYVVPKKTKAVCVGNT